MLGLTERILLFIHSRFPKDCNWLNGNCYYFCVILMARFPNELSIYYDAIAGHFIVGAPLYLETGIKVVYYDWTGIYEPRSMPILLEDIKKNDESWYRRLVRDCIL